MTKTKRGATLTCHKCGTDYYVPPCRIGNSRYCSKACFDSAQQTRERKSIPCQRCGKEFLAVTDHGKWPKSCSVECRDAGAPKPETKECLSCGGQFVATRASHNTVDKLRIHCSQECRHKGMIKGSIRTCICCDKEFYLCRSQGLRSNDDSCCSAECRGQYYTRERSKGWKGGTYLDTTVGTRNVLLPRDGFVSLYIGEHRVVASRVIGRMLKTHEPVIHLNNNKADNRPDNLYICESRRDMRRRQIGDLPWPKKSNLENYK